MALKDDVCAGRRLRFTRLLNKLELDELSEETGIPVETLIEYESGKLPEYVDELIPLLHALHMSADYYVLGYVDKEKLKESAIQLYGEYIEENQLDDFCKLLLGELDLPVSYKEIDDDIKQRFDMHGKNYEIARTQAMEIIKLR